MWRGMIVDGWRDILKAQKKSAGLSNLRIAELAGFSEGVVARFFADHSDPPISQIVTVAEVLSVPICELFSSLPNGMKTKELLEDYARISSENQALRDANTELRDRLDQLKDELLSVHRYYMRRDG